MRQLEVCDLRQVGGGLAFLAPVTATMLADTGFYGAISMAFGVGFGGGTAIQTNDLVNATDGPSMLALGNLGA